MWKHVFPLAVLCLLSSCGTLEVSAHRTPTPGGRSSAISVSNLDRLVEQASWGKGGILSAQFSLDSLSLGVVTPLGVYVYDIGTLEQLRFFPGESSVTTAAFSPDWSVLAVGSVSSVTLERTDNGKRIMQLDSAKKGAVSRLMFSPDGSLLASMVTPPGEEVYSQNVELWRISDRKLLISWNISVYDHVAFAPDRKSFIAWNISQPRSDGVRRWQIPFGAPVPAGTNWDPYPAAFSPDGKFYAAEAYDKVLIARVTDKHAVGEFSAKDSQFFESALFSPDSSLLVALTNHGVVDVWSAARGMPLESFELDPTMDQLLAISPDSKTLAVRAADGIAFYRLSDGALLRRLSGHPTSLNRAAFSPGDDRLAAAVGNDALAVWRVPDGQLLYVVPKADAFSLAWSLDEEWLALGEPDGNIRVLHAVDGALERSITPHSGSIAQVLGLAFSPDGSLLASSTMYSIKLWKFDDGTLVRDIGVRGGFVDAVRFSPDGKFLTAFRGDETIGVWRVADGQEIWDLPAAVPTYSNSIDFAPDDSFLAIGKMSQVELWNFSGARLLRSLPAGDATVTALRISPDGSLLVAGLTDGTIEFWQIPEGKYLRSLKAGNGEIRNLNFSADGRILLAASSDGIVWLWGVTK